MSNKDNDSRQMRSDESAQQVSGSDPAKNRITEPQPDPERHLKRIRQVFQVSTRIQELVRKRRQSPPRVESNIEAKTQLVSTSVPGIKGKI